VTVVDDEVAALPHALDYARRGWFVVPLHSVRSGVCTCRDHSCQKHAGKHPVGWLCPNGCKDASRYPARITRWWTCRPTANIGIVTGPSCLVVLDVDPRNGGVNSLTDLVARVGPLPRTLTARTGGGGSHYVYGDPERRARKRVLAPGLDVVANNAFIVATPSIHRSGERYQWLDATEPVSDAPTWLLERDL
jgi:hypothetical protein